MAFRKLVSAAIAVLLLLKFTSADIAFSAMSSTTYQVLWDSVSVGGDDTSSSTSYLLRDTLGESTTGAATGTTYTERDGYRGNTLDQVVTFQTFPENRSTQTAATTLSSLTVTVTSVAAFSVGQRIVLVQDEGNGQVCAFGKIASIGATTLVVDAWTTNGTLPTIDGVNDYVYRMLGTTIDLGTLATSTVATSVVGWEVNADVSQGYSVYLFENRDLTSSGTAMTIGDVGDGTVTAGSSEYGAISSDTTLALSTFDTQDTGITTSLQQVASRADNSYSSRDFVILKVAVSSALETATYSNTMSFVFVGDY